MLKTVVIIQSRTTSSRLPGKAFLSIQGYPAIILCAKRAMNQGAQVCVATSDEPSDDALAHLLLEHKIPCFRGPLDDVLKRYVMASKALKLTDYVVRLTADNVFPDGNFIQRLIDETVSNRWEYATTYHKVTGLPLGLGGEIFTVELLRRAEKMANTQHEREHVNPWMQANTKLNYVSYPLSQKMDHLSCTIDTLSDYLKILSVYEGVADPVMISWQTLAVRLYQQHIRLQEKTVY